VSLQLSGQPTAYAEVVRQVLIWAGAMGFIHMTPEQQGLTLSMVSALLAVVVWAKVMPTQTIEDAGHNVTKIKQDAAANVAAGTAAEAQRVIDSLKKEDSTNKKDGGQ